MVKLQKLVKDGAIEVMTSRVEIYLPSTINREGIVKKQTEKEFREGTFKTISLFSSLFGGATYDAAIGAWIMQNGRLVTEKVNIVYSFCRPIDLKQHFKQILKEAGRIKSELGQEAVTIVVNGQAMFV
ncbi:MAG TPA: hypothetical protein DEQ02_00325 [Ruminococcaceae bacterium]|nr:hypothetical protein [Oscillospiraceae bacterium]